MALSPGPKTDSTIARHVWKAFVVTDTQTGENYMVDQSDFSKKVSIPPYSTDHDAAYRVVEFYQNKGWSVRIRNIPEKDIFLVCFFKQDGRTYRFMQDQKLPMAICMAALDLINGTHAVT